MNKIPIICLIPVWKRPKILEYHVKSHKNIDTSKVKFVYILSFEDEFFNRNLEILKEFDFIVADNKPLGAKINKGLKYILAKYEFDYLMNCGSDDIFLTDIVKIYEPLMAINTKIFGFNACYSKKIHEKRVISLRNLQPLHPIGAGRMIRSDLINGIYDEKLDRGLDSCSIATILNRNINIKPVILDGIAPILDLKSNTNLNPIEVLTMMDEINQNQLPFDVNLY